MRVQSKLLSKRKFLFLCRHGNTFEKGQPTYIVGCNEDLPLTEEGERQAEELGEVLAQSDLGSHALSIRCGKLSRTKRYAEILSKKINLGGSTLNIEGDSLLTELDYGSWSGKTAKELEQEGFKEALKSWDEFALWPVNTGFKPEEQQVGLEITKLLHDQAKRDQTALFVTSNGRLKFFHRVISSQSSVTSPKMTTGACSLVEFHDNSWKILFWNLKRDELRSALNLLRKRAPWELLLKP